MKPKTVGRKQSGLIPQMRTEFTHVGLMAGTILLTADDDTPIDLLVPGDRIVTRNAGLVPLEAITSERITVEAVAIAADAFGASHPRQDVVMPAAQMVLVRDWRAKALHGATQAVMPAGCLIDDHLITSLGPREMTLFRLGFHAPYVIYAEGLEISIPALRAADAVAA
ncbi:Hint domain-containing protein [Tateyamaria pelophila]|uniref:Hint domain-containing protein n=1 Tax=Tateyamaria pelophila TaxID=328415 RepID=UPI001CBD7796|nr:Hint domain-containing protein [Tateyamaria pelophila]